MSLEKHQFTIHSAVTQFACTHDLCNATCPSQGILEMHMQTHRTNKPFSCNKCGKDFTRKYHLERHNLHSTCDNSTKKVTKINALIYTIFIYIFDPFFRVLMPVKFAPKYFQELIIYVNIYVVIWDNQQRKRIFNVHIAIKRFMDLLY